MPQIPPFLGEFSDEDVKWLIAVGDKAHVAPGEAIIVEGKGLADIFFVLEGTFRLSSSKYPVPPLELGVGELLGEMSYVQKQPPLASVTAVEDAVVLCVPRSDIDRRLARDEGFALRFHKVLAGFTVSRIYGQWTSGALGGGEPEPPSDAGPETPPDPGPEPPPAPAPPPEPGPPTPPAPGAGLDRVWWIIKKILEEDRPPTDAGPDEPRKPEGPSAPPGTEGPS